MTERRSRLLVFALCCSLALHFSTFVYFYYNRSAARAGGHKGVVSVDFVQAVRHEPPRPKEVAARPVKRGEVVKPTPAQPTPTQPPPPTSEATAQPAGDPAVVASETSVFISSVERLLSQKKVYPKISIDRGEQGRVMVGLTLDRDGRLMDAKLEEPAPFSRLNEAALQTVSGVGKFPAVPAVVPAPIHLHVPIVFQIENN